MEATSNKTSLGRLVEINNANITIRFRPSEILFGIEGENNQAKHN